MSFGPELTRFWKILFSLVSYEFDFDNRTFINKVLVIRNTKFKISINAIALSEAMASSLASLRHWKKIASFEAENSSNNRVDWVGWLVPCSFSSLSSKLSWLSSVWHRKEKLIYTLSFGSILRLSRLLACFERPSQTHHLHRRRYWLDVHDGVCWEKLAWWNFQLSSSNTGTSFFRLPFSYIWCKCKWINGHLLGSNLSKTLRQNKDFSCFNQWDVRRLCYRQVRDSSLGGFPIQSDVTLCCV